LWFFFALEITSSALADAIGVVVLLCFFFSLRMLLQALACEWDRPAVA
jgi:hypothetical protein